MWPVDSRSAYEARAAEYIDLLGSMEATAAADREQIADWAASVAGLVLDVGCGPGHWTDFLERAGVAVLGLDPVEAFIQHAVQRFPQCRFAVARAQELPVAAGGVAGVLAWYSLIHTDPEHLDRALAEFARVLRPGGGVLLGFFAGDRVEIFDHAVTPAWFWPPELLANRLEAAGFRVDDVVTRHSPGPRSHGAITARRIH